jgi:hypothetical protein
MSPLPSPLPLGERDRVRGYFFNFYFLKNIDHGIGDASCRELEESLFMSPFYVSGSHEKLKQGQHNISGFSTISSAIS